LFNNAGYGVYGTIEDLPLEDIKGQFDVNVFGQARVLKAVLPHMRRQKSGLIINMSSVVGQVSLAISGWYAATKHAVEAMSDALRQEVKHLGINVVIIEPGAVKTGFDGNAFGFLDRKGYSDEYTEIAVNFRRFMSEKYDKCGGPERTADTIVEAIESKNPKTRYRTTGDAKRYILMKRLLPDGMLDNMILDSLKKSKEG
jgi:short-subunit dehydrogenase